MERSLTTQAAGVALVVAFAFTTMFADATGALLRSSGNVIVDGNAAPSSLALFAGDKISTGSQGGAATITASGSILTLSPGTSLTYGTNSVEMECGRLAVTALQPGLTAKIRNLQVSAASEGSTYEISHAGGKLIIDVRAGSALVEDGQQKMTLVAGKEMTLASPGECSDTPTGKAKQDPPARGFHMTNGKMALLSGAGAGAIAAGVVIAEHGSKPCVSNDGSPACK